MNIIQDNPISKKISSILCGDEWGQTTVGWNLTVEMVTCLILGFLMMSGATYTPEYIFIGIGFLFFLFLQFLFAWHSILRSNAFEFYAFIVMSFLCWLSMLFKSLHHIKQYDPQGWTLWTFYTCNVILTLNTLSYFALGPKVFSLMKFETFKKIGTSKAKKDWHTTYETFKSMSKFNAALGVYGYTSLVYYNMVQHFMTWMYVFDAVFLLVVMYLSIVGFRSGKNVKLTGLYAFFIGTALFQAYRVFRMWVVISHWSDIFPDGEETFESTRFTLIVFNIVTEFFSCLAVLVLLWTICMLPRYALADDIRKSLVDYNHDSYQNAEPDQQDIEVTERNSQPTRRDSDY